MFYIVLENKKLPSPLNPKHLLNQFLPIIAILIKREQNFKYIGFDLFLGLISKIDDHSLKVNDLSNYSIKDFILDIINFLGGPEPSIKKVRIGQFLSIDLYRCLDVSSFEYIISEILSDNLSEDSECPKGGIKDKEISFLILLVKNCFSKEIKSSKNGNIFSKGFLHILVSKSTTSQIFFLDIVEILSSGLSFLHSLILFDKKNKNLGFYDKEFLNMKASDLNELYKLVKNWIDKDDNEKLKFVEKTYFKNTGLRTETLENYNKNEDNESVTKSDNLIKKNQTMICLNLIIQVDSLITNILKEMK